MLAGSHRNAWPDETGTGGRTNRNTHVLHFGWKNSFCVRDIRRTCKTLGVEADIDRTVLDRIQNHALNDVASKHYDKNKHLRNKRRALATWHCFVDEVIKLAEDPEQIRLHRELNGEIFV